MKPKYFIIAILLGILFGIVMGGFLATSSQNILLEKAFERGITNQYDYTRENYDCQARIIPEKYNEDNNLFFSKNISGRTSTEASLIIRGYNGTEVLTVSSNGGIFYQGKLVGNDSEIPILLKRALKISLGEQNE